MHIMPQTIVGVVALLVAVTSLLSIALSYGLPYGFQHYISYLKAKQEDTVLREFIKRFSFLSILISLISVISLLIFSSALDSFLFHRLVPTEIIQLLGINLFAVEMNALFNGMVMGLQDYRKSAHILIFSYVSSYSLSIIMFEYTSMLQFMIIGWAIGNLVSTFFFVKTLYSKFKKCNYTPSPKTSRTPIRKVFSYSIPLFLSSSITIGASYVDRLVVAYYLPLAKLAIYNLSLLIASSLLALVLPVNNILLTKISSLFASNEVEKIKLRLRTFVFVLYYFYIPVAFLILVILQPTIIFLGGKKYVGAFLPTALIILVSALFISYNVLIQGYSGIRKTRIVYLSSIVTFITNLTCSVTLVPLFGVLGGAVGYSSIFIFNFFILYIFGRRIKLIEVNWWPVVKIFLLAISIFILVMLFETFLGNSTFYTVCYFGIYAILYIIITKKLKLLGRDEIDIIHYLIPINFPLVKRLLNWMF